MLMFLIELVFIFIQLSFYFLHSFEKSNEDEISIGVEQELLIGLQREMEKVNR